MDTPKRFNKDGFIPLIGENTLEGKKLVLDHDYKNQELLLKDKRHERWLVFALIIAAFVIYGVLAWLNKDNFANPVAGFILTLIGYFAGTKTG